MHPGRGEAWWAAGDRVAWHDGQTLWGVVADGILAAPCPPPRAVFATPTGWRAWLARATIRLEPDGGTTPGRAGVAVAVRRDGMRWAVDGLDVPDAVGAASAAWPFPTGDGVLFRSAGWLFRVAGGRTRAVAPATGKERVLVGPNGAFLIGDAHELRLGAAPGRSAAPLPIRLRADAWGLRWSEDGARVAGLDLDNRGVRVDLARGRLERLAGLPVDVDRVLDADGRIAGLAWPRAPLREASWARVGERLAGPGGVVWDLGDARPRGPATIRLGATIPCGAGWASVDWETGRGAVLDADGAPIADVALPLDDGEVVDFARDGVIVTDADRGFTVGVDGAVAEAEAVAPAPRGRVDRSVGGATVAIDAEATIGARRWAWGTDGWLVVRGPALP